MTTTTDLDEARLAAGELCRAGRADEAAPVLVNALLEAVGIEGRCVVGLHRSGAVLIKGKGKK